MKKEPDKQEYQQIVKNLTPKHNSLLNCAKAFVVGGVFCVLEADNDNIFWPFQKRFSALCDD